MVALRRSFRVTKGTISASRDGGTIAAGLRSISEPAGMRISPAADFIKLRPNRLLAASSGACWF